MSRCDSRRALAALAFMSVLCLPALAQAPASRNFPQAALRGEMMVLQSPEISLNGRPALLAASARIRGQDNLIVMPASISGTKWTVNYTAGPYGVMDVWLLRPEEAKRPWPRTPEEAARWAFDPFTQAWVKR